METIKLSDLEHGDIVMTHTIKWNIVSRAIQWFTKEYYSHAFIYETTQNKNWAFEADKVGVCFTNFNSYYCTGKYEMLIGKPNNIINKLPKARLIEVSMELTDRPYDFINLIFHQPIKYIFHKWIGRSKEQAYKRFVCVELVAYVYNKFTGLFLDWNEVGNDDLINSKDFTWYKLDISK